MDILKVLTCGSVDDGKSTLMGRLLYDSELLMDDHAEKLKAGGEFAHLTDGLRAEREQGITIDVAYRYFRTANRRFIFADSPGHFEYTRNMVTAASNSDLALILIDAAKGISPQTRLHSFLASILGIKQVILCVNKMDSQNYAESVFQKISQDFSGFTEQLNFEEVQIVPMSALNGDNIVFKSEHMPWYTGKTLLEYLENLTPPKASEDLPARFAVQWVTRTEDFRGYAGKVFGGEIKIGDEIYVLPSLRKSKIKSIHIGEASKEIAHTGESVTLTLEDDVDVGRGHIIVAADKTLPQVTDNFEASLFWLHENEFNPSRKYLLKTVNKTYKAKVTDLCYGIDVETLSQKEISSIGLNEIARIKLKTATQVIHEFYGDSRRLGSFLLIDESSNDTLAAGIITRKPQNEQSNDQKNYFI